VEWIDTGDSDCNHTWELEDRDTRFKKSGRIEQIRKKSRCVKCGAEVMRKVSRRC
jgi:hypothetical protein